MPHPAPRNFRFPKNRYLEIRRQELGFCSTRFIIDSMKIHKSIPIFLFFAIVLPEGRLRDWGKGRSRSQKCGGEAERSLHCFRYTLLERAIVSTWVLFFSTEVRSEKASFGVLVTSLRHIHKRTKRFSTSKNAAQYPNAYICVALIRFGRCVSDVTTALGFVVLMTSHRPRDHKHDDEYAGAEK
jgi:hypothetical protein